MPLDASETLFSTQTLLWLAGSAAAALLLFGSINRRRSRLTETLREYVDRDHDGSQPTGDTGAADSPTAAQAPVANSERGTTREQDRSASN